MEERLPALGQWDKQTNKKYAPHTSACLQTAAEIRLLIHINEIYLNATV